MEGYNMTLLDALRKRYEADIAHAQANIGVYLNNSAVIGEHPDLLAEVDKYVGKLESAQGKLNALGEHFSSSLHKPKELLVESESE